MKKSFGYKKFPGGGSQSPLNSQFFVQVPWKLWEGHPLLALGTLYQTIRFMVIDLFLLNFGTPGKNQSLF